MKSHLPGTKEVAALHTPGPWLLEERTVYALQQDGWYKGAPVMVNRFSVQVQVGRANGGVTPRAELDANARLIAAAPEMFDMLSELATMAESDAALFNDDSLMKPFYIVQAEKIRGLLKKCQQANSKEAK